MTESHSPEEQIPHAVVTRRKRRFSLVWLIPVVAALIGGWLVVKALTDKGPEITIYFKSAESLEAGKTKVKYKDVEIGQVDRDHVRPGLLPGARESAAGEGGRTPTLGQHALLGGARAGDLASRVGPGDGVLGAPTSPSIPGPRAPHSPSSPGSRSPPS